MADAAKKPAAAAETVGAPAAAAATAAGTPAAAMTAVAAAGATVTGTSLRLGGGLPTVLHTNLGPFDSSTP